MAFTMTYNTIVMFNVLQAFIFVVDSGLALFQSDNSLFRTKPAIPLLLSATIFFV